MKIVGKIVGTNAAITVLLLIAYWSLGTYEDILFGGFHIFFLYTLLCLLTSLGYFLSKETDAALKKKYALGYLVSAFVVSGGFILPWLLLMVFWDSL